MTPIELHRFEQLVRENEQQKAKIEALEKEIAELKKVVVSHSEKEN